MDSQVLESIILDEMAMTLATDAQVSMASDLEFTPEPERSLWLRFEYQTDIPIYIDGIKKHAVLRCRAEVESTSTVLIRCTIRSTNQRLISRNIKIDVCNPEWLDLLQLNLRIAAAYLFISNLEEEVSADFVLALLVGLARQQLVLNWYDLSNESLKLPELKGTTSRGLVIWFLRQQLGNHQLQFGYFLSTSDQIGVLATIEGSHKYKSIGQFEHSVAGANEIALTIGSRVRQFNA